MITVNGFIGLCRVLAMPFPRGDLCTWSDAERECEEQRREAYERLIRAPDVSPRISGLLSEFANSAPQYETHGEAQSRIVQYARRWLVRLEAELEREQNATEREKFLNECADYDPFINSNLTRDAFAGRIPAEREVRPNEG
jgi:hypothetical protein